MGNYLNPDNSKFQEALNSDIYVDKTGLITYTNSVIHTQQKCICVSRPRRFGKSMAANMLSAYYSRGCDSKELFQNLEIAEDAQFETYLNQYDVIFLNVQEFLSQSKNIDEMISLIRRSVLWDLLGEYPEFRYFDTFNLTRTMQDVYQQTKCPFVVIIDEWDCVFREYKTDRETQERYLDFLRDLLKDKGYIHLAYMTGILPIKKYGTHSALNMFDEFSMIEPGPLASYVGFTETEVQKLCEVYGQKFEEVKRWYDGYQIGKYHVYNPNAVVNLMLEGEFQSYWSGTASYEAIVPLINMDFDGLKSAVIEMLSGDHVPVDVTSFQNDTVSFANKDDVLTYLIHLGYLAYDRTFRTAFIPNEEIRQELILATKRKKWNELIVFQKESEQLLKDTIQMNGNAVAKEIEKIHREYTSVIQYNNENSLSSVLSIAYLSSMQYYFKPIREFPAGRGFADFVFIPKPEFQNYYPALVVELKWDKSVRAALDQIRDGKYPESVACYAGELLLVGINYNEKTKEHECRIEKYEK